MAIRLLSSENISGSLTVTGNASIGGGLSAGVTTITSDTGLNIYTSTNAVGAEIAFSDVTNRTQKGFITYFHADTVSYGSGNAFVITGDQATMTILADGKLMYKEGIYLKPATGTGAGTRKDNLWDAAYNDKITALAVAGTTTKTLTATQQDGGTLTASWTDNDSGGTVTGTGANTQVAFWTGTSVIDGSSDLRWDNTNKELGIGRNPDFALDVFKSSGTSSSTTGTTMQRLWNYVGADLSQQKTFIDFVFQDGNDNQYPQVRIGAEVGQNGDADTQEKEGSGAFVVYTNNAPNSTPGTNALAERFRVDYAGNVGIGTTTPQTTLQVNGAASALNAHFGQGQNNSSGVFGGISLGYAENANAAYRKVAIVAKAIGDGAARQELHFLVDSVSDSNSADIADSKMMIDINGDVGIGTGVPKGKLEIKQNMTAGTIAAFAEPHLRLAANNTVDSTGFVGMTFATSTADNYGFSWGALRTTSALGGMHLRYHGNSEQGSDIFNIDYTGNVTIATGKYIRSSSSGGFLTIQGGATYPGGRIDLYGGSNAGPGIEFLTGGAGAATVRMKINSTGKVGIATAGGINSQLTVETPSVAAGGTLGASIFAITGTSETTPTSGVVTPTNEIQFKPAMPAGYSSDGYNTVLEQQSGGNRVFYFRTSGAGHLSIDVEQDGSFGGNLTVTGTAQFLSTGTSNFAGNLVVNNMLTINIDDISTGENRGLRIINTSGVDQQWNITAGVTGEENDSFCIRNSTDNINALKINRAGDTLIHDDIFVGSNGFFGDLTDAATRKVRVQTAAEYDSLIELRESTDNYGFTLGYYGSPNTFQIKRHDNNATGVTVLTIPRTSSVVTFSSALVTPGATINGQLNQNGTIACNNTNITGVNHITINDPGPTEGIEWNNGNGWRIVECPDNMTTNGAGNLQFSTSGTRRVTVTTAGALSAVGDVIAYSDRRVKENIKTIDNALEKVSKLRGVSYNRTDSEDKSDKIGVIAQEVIDVVPEVVTYGESDDRYSVSYGNMAGMFIEAIKELKAEVEELKKQIK